MWFHYMENVEKECPDEMDNGPNLLRPDDPGGSIADWY
jgi:hypothetical protein